VAEEAGRPLARNNALLFYQESKAKRLKKIKSKAYHRHLKKHAAAAESAHTALDDPATVQARACMHEMHITMPLNPVLVATANGYQMHHHDKGSINVGWSSCFKYIFFSFWVGTRPDHCSPQKQHSWGPV
jgi:hypothetical protein